MVLAPSKSYGWTGKSKTSSGGRLALAGADAYTVEHAVEWAVKASMECLEDAIFDEEFFNENNSA
ncbi:MULTISPECIES: hypothetical protein [Mesorhizobium]|uniref:hypothetical protein n=1 Tax=unclassified Mesorhizobium TaxID=325217 RepID=UPI000AD6E99B|nr:MULTISPECIES: hypothetical protein [Mesorhizobium]